MTCPARGFARVPPAEGVDAMPVSERRQRLTALGLLATVVVLDQTTKWWAWRHASRTFINAGGTWLIGRPVDGWFAGPVSGPLLDLLDLGLLSLAGVVLVRRRRRARALVTGALMIGGWGSNLLDRLGMHFVTAPGSIRGAVDFIPLGPPLWNVADFVVIGATALFLVAVCVRGARDGGAGAAGRPTRPVARPPRWDPRRARIAGVGSVAAVAAVASSVPAAIGAGDDAGVTSSPRASTGAGSRA
jgi:lipoprotein signal peptidase